MTLPTTNGDPIPTATIKIDGHSSASADNYLVAGKALGCPTDQLVRFLKAGIVLHPRQLAASAAARACDVPHGPTEIGYGGARGGGKSHWLLAQMGADDCQRVPGLKCLLLRKVGKANLEHLDDLRRTLFRSIPHEFAAYRGILSFPNGSRIVCGHFQTESDVEAYLGLEYDVIGIEEATTLSHTKFEHIRTCNRSSRFLDRHVRWRPRIYSTTNPGGAGHVWYKARFLEPFLRKEETETRFIPAKAADNHFLNPEYLNTLTKLTGWQRRAWLDGDWDIAAGQFFTTFNRAHHVIPEFDPARAVEWFCAMDYGFRHYTVVLLGCRDGDGNIFVLDEHAEREWLPERHAEAIHAMLARYNLAAWKLRRFNAGADVFAKSESASIADQYRKLGLRLTPANMNRVNGWAEVLSRLGDPAKGIQPKLFLHERCRLVCETLPTLQHDPGRPEDVLKVDMDESGIGGDDAADALRYLVASKPKEVAIFVA